MRLYIVVITSMLCLTLESLRGGMPWYELAYRLSDGSEITVSVGQKHIIGAEDNESKEYLKKTFKLTDKAFTDGLFILEDYTRFTYSLLLTRSAAPQATLPSTGPSLKSIKIGELVYFAADRTNKVFSDPGYFLVQAIAGNSRNITVVYEENHYLYAGRFHAPFDAKSVIAHNYQRGPSLDDLGGHSKSVMMGDDGNSVVVEIQESPGAKLRFRLEEKEGRIFWISEKDKSK